MNFKTFPAIVMALSLGACASVPPPPHCSASGQGLQPINPDMVTQNQREAVSELQRQKRLEQERLERLRQGGGQ